MHKKQTNQACLTEFELFTTEASCLLYLGSRLQYIGDLVVKILKQGINLLHLTQVIAEILTQLPCVYVTVNTQREGL